MLLFKSSNGKTNAIVLTRKRVSEARPMIIELAKEKSGGYQEWEIYKLTTKLKKFFTANLELDTLYEEQNA